MFGRRKQNNEEEANDNASSGGTDSGDESDSSSAGSTASKTPSSSSPPAKTGAGADPKKVEIDKDKGRMAKKGSGFYNTVRKGQRFKLKNVLRNQRVIAAEIIQRYVRGHLWRRAEERRLAREARIAKERNIRHVRRRQMERDYWWDADVDTDELHRYQLEDLLMRLGMATSGTREQLLVRFKRWVLHRAIVADLGVQCSAVAVERTLNGSGGAYTIDVPTPSRRDPPLVQLRQFQGKGYMQLGAGHASDSVYAIDRRRHLYLLRGVDHYTNTSPPTHPEAHGRGGKSAMGPMGAGASGGASGGGGGGFGQGGGWLLSGRWLSILKNEETSAVVLGGHFSVCASGGGEAYTWGLNPHGELGSGKPISMDDPQEPTGLHLLPATEAVSKVAAGTYHSACVCVSGRVYAWGCNTSNELAQENTFTGDLRDTFYSSPACVDYVGSHPLPGTTVRHRRHVVLVSCGASHTACVDREGRVLTWGCRDGGRLGRRRGNADWPAPLVHPDDDGGDAAATQTSRMSQSSARATIRPQSGAAPGEVDDLYEVDRVVCLELCCGAWHTVLLCAPRDDPEWGPHKHGGLGNALEGGGGGTLVDVSSGGGGGGGCGGGTLSKGESTREKSGRSRGTSKGGGKSSSRRLKRAERKGEKGVGGEMKGKSGDGQGPGVGGDAANLGFGIGQGTRPGLVYTFGSGLSGQLGIGEVTLAQTPLRVRRGGGMPSDVVSVRAGTYVTACAQSNGQVWYWGARGAGMFQPVPLAAELPTGQRAGGLTDFACTRDCVVFLTNGVGPEYFEQMVDAKVDEYKAERLADEAAFALKLEVVLAERKAKALRKAEAFMRGAMARWRFARWARKQYVNRKVVDPDTGRKRRVYVNLVSGHVVRRRPYFLKGYGMEPEKEEELFAARLIQAVVRRRYAILEAKRLALSTYEGPLFNEDFPDRPFWYNPKTGASFWTRPRWLDDDDEEGGSDEEREEGDDLDVGGEAIGGV